MVNMPKFTSEQDLNSLKRKQLQKLARKHGIKANLKSNTIIEKLIPIIFDKNSNSSKNLKISKSDCEITSTSSKRIRICGHNVIFTTLQSCFNIHNISNLTK